MREREREMEPPAGEVRGELASFQRRLLAELRAALQEAQAQQQQALERHEDVLNRLLVRGGSCGSSASSHFAARAAAAASPPSPPCRGVSASARSTDNERQVSDSCEAAVPTLEDGCSPRSGPGRGETGHLNFEDVEMEKGAFNFGGIDKSRLGQEDYDVAQFYKASGPSQAVARSDVFCHVTLGVIVMNAIYLGVDADTNDASMLVDADWPYQISEHSFCVFFFVEWLVRFCAFRHKHDCIKDMWFKFDSALVCLMVLETWIAPLLMLDLPTGPLRLLRLMRLSRLVRLMRALPELVTMVKGMWVASRAVLCSLLMVMLLIYVFAIMLLLALKSEEAVENRFGTLLMCMWTLLMDGTFLDNTGEVMTELLEMNKFNTLSAVVMFMAFILLSSMTVMNMLIGVLCEVVSAVAQNERDEAAIRLLKSTILKELTQVDLDGSGTLNNQELTNVMSNPHAMAVMRTLEVDVACLQELQQVLFADQEDQEVPIEHIMELLLTYRGNLGTTVRHVVDGHASTRKTVGAFVQRFEDRLGLRLDDLSSQLDLVWATLAAAPRFAPGLSPQVTSANEADVLQPPTTPRKNEDAEVWSRRGFRPSNCGPETYLERPCKL